MLEDYDLLLNRFRLGRVLLRVNHNAFERVDRAQHLWVLRFDQSLLVFLLHVFAAGSKKYAFLLGTDGNPNIRGDTVTMDDLFARRVILRGGKTERGSVGQLQNVLHGAFS